MDVHDLLAIEQIKQLRARYCRLVDTKDWDGFRACFTDGMSYVDDAKELTVGPADAFVAWVSKRHARSISVHSATNPEILLTGPDTAVGTWGLMDYVEIPREGGGRTVQRGSGHYHERYERQADDWRIAEVHVTRLRLEVTELR